MVPEGGKLNGPQMLRPRASSFFKADKFDYIKETPEDKGPFF